MNPDIESFLDEVFQSVQPTSPEIGRVVVEPDYDVDPSPTEADGLRTELVQLLSKQSPENSAALASREGVELDISAGYPLLAKYLRNVTLHQDKLDGSWIEVAPPGNWI